MELGIKQRTKQWFNQRFNQWLNRRVPASNQQQLSNKNIFILPTKFGYAYIFSVFILFLLGTNYQNNLIILMSYLFASVFLTSMLHSFFNLSRLSFIFSSKLTTHAQQTIMVPLSVISKNKRFDLSFQFSGNDTLYCKEVLAGESVIKIPYLPQSRGVNNPGRLKISSEYVFGLFISWTHLDFDCEVLTYPAKKTFNHLKLNATEQHAEIEGSRIVEGGDDFGELREYKQGESNAQIAWKQLARGQGRLTKTTQQTLGSTTWLSLKQLPAAAIEVKLEMLCFLALDHHKSNVTFGLELDAIKISPASGNQHLLTCLEALALYGKSNTVISPNEVSK